MPLEPDTHVVIEPFTAPGRTYHWYHKVGALMLIVLCLELGLFLLLSPWWPEYWEHRLPYSIWPGSRAFWESPYFRGCISGLGVLDICIAFADIFRLRRFQGS